MSATSTRSCCARRKVQHRCFEYNCVLVGHFAIWETSKQSVSSFCTESMSRSVALTARFIASASSLALPLAIFFSAASPRSESAGCGSGSAVSAAARPAAFGLVSRFAVESCSRDNTRGTHMDSDPQRTLMTPPWFCQQLRRRTSCCIAVAHSLPPSCSSRAESRPAAGGLDRQQPAGEATAQRGR